jgi:hypothetical protein
MDEKHKSPPRRLRRWIVPLVLCGLLIVIAAALYIRGRTVWTDGHGARANDETLREVVWTTPQPIEPPIFATAEDQQYEPAFSRDATELYFVRGKPGDGQAHIYASYRRDNQWTAPALLQGVNGPTDDLSPRLTSDSQFLLFSSDRPGGLGGFDIWAAPRLAGGKWGAPYNLGPAVNSEFNESNPDPTPDGKRLIFSTDRKAAGKEQIQAWRATIRQTVSTDYDLWIARLDESANAEGQQSTSAPATTRPARGIRFKDAREVPGGINTTFVEGASCVSPVGDFIYFSSNRTGGHGKFDLYRSRITGGGETFGPVENLGPAVNTAGNETDPALIFGGFRLCFSSDRDNPRGVYALFRSDSREVFAVREGRPFPRFGWSAWLLLFSALLLIPLIMALRGTDMGRRLSILQKCLLLSLLVHVALTFVFSFIQVTQEVIHQMRRDTNREIAVNLNLPKDVEIGLAVRSQLSSDLPTGDAAPTSSAKAVLPDETSSAQPAAVKTVVPAADRTVVVTPSVAAPAPPPAMFSIAAPTAKATLLPEIPSPVHLLDMLAPEMTALHVADSKPDVAPAPVESPIVVSRSAPAAPQSSAPPMPDISASVPKASAAATSANPADLHAPPPVLSASALVAAAAASSNLPALNLPDTAEGFSDLNPLVPAGTSRHLTQSDPVAPQFTAPSPTSSPLAPVPRDSTAGSTPPATIGVATGNSAAPPTTAPSEFADQSLKPAPYRATHLSGVTNSMAPLATSAPTTPDPIARIEPTLQPITAAIPRASNDRQPSRPTADDAHVASARLAAPSVGSSKAPANIAVTTAAPVLPPSTSEGSAGSITDGIAPRSAPIAAIDAALQPTVAFVPIPGPINLGPVGAPVAPFPRAPEVRKPRIEQLGGNKASEDAVDRGLAYLARNQEPDGRWTFIATDDVAASRGRRPRGYHDMGSTGLAILAFITRDNTPDKPGPYRNNVNKALNFLLANQDAAGDLRGPPQARGADSTQADMYDHAIATLALAEAAVMSGGDKRYADAALRGARFIIAAQDPESGGWRYVPGQFGDTSVFGWQIMALHACEKLGFEIPRRTRALADDWIRLATQGPRRMLAAYQPRRVPTPPMTAEMLYTRMLLGQKLDDADIEEATDFLAQSRPDVRQPNVYYWYYGSLCMLQVHNDLWKRWNAQTRDALIALQTKTSSGNGAADGSWNADPKYGARGGRIYMTSLALLTLEIYYRYDAVVRPE